MRAFSAPRWVPLLSLLPVLSQPVVAQEKAQKAESIRVEVKVLPGLIRYETTRFDVTAGAPVKLTFSNDCVMPHNLVILRADAETALVAAVNAMGLEGMEKHFVPEVPGLVAATTLLQPATQELLSFNAPEKEGDYPYVCTFPGHWYTMRGVMRVRAVGVKLEAPQKSKEKVPQVEDALKNSGMTHKPMGTLQKPFVMRSFVPDPGLDPAVFSHHGMASDAVKYDPATRLDINTTIKDPVSGEVREVPAKVKAEKGIAGAIAVNHGPEFSYVWDSTECRLMYAWRGGFLNMDPYWGKEPGSGRQKIYIPLIMGNLVYRASGEMPQAEKADPAPLFLGYKMEHGTPEFRYRVGAKIFRETVVPKGSDGFEVRVTQEGPSSPLHWKIAPADVGFIQAREDGNGVVLSIKDRPEPPQPAPLPAESPKQKKS